MPGFAFLLVFDLDTWERGARRRPQECTRRDSQKPKEKETFCVGTGTGADMFVRPDAVRRDSDDDGGASSGSDTAPDHTPPDKATLLKVFSSNAQILPYLVYSTEFRCFFLNIFFTHWVCKTIILLQKSTP